MWGKAAKSGAGLTTTIGKRAGLGTARTTTSGSAFTRCRPLNTQDRTVNGSRRSYAISIARRAARGDFYAAQQALPADPAPLRSHAVSAPNHNLGPNCCSNGVWRIGHLPNAAPQMPDALRGVRSGKSTALRGWTRCGITETLRALITLRGTQWSQRFQWGQWNWSRAHA